MNSPVPPLLKPRRRYGRWVLLGFVILTAPLVIVGAGVVSMLTLNRDAAVLRREVMAATEADWHTRVQLSAGGVTLGALRTLLGLVEVEHGHMDEARLALKAVRQVSVGVYECDDRSGDFSQEQLFTRTDRKMRARGWSRLVGVTEGSQAVLVYASDDSAADERLEVCVAVVDDDQLVIVSGRVEADALARLVEQHAPKGELGRKLKLARL